MRKREKKVRHLWAQKMIPQSAPYSISEGRQEYPNHAAFKHVKNTIYDPKREEKLRKKIDDCIMSQIRCSEYKDVMSKKGEIKRIQNIACKAVKLGKTGSNERVVEWLKRDGR
jgi:hypothetical protein